MKKKTRAILALILAGLLTASLVGGCVALNYQPAPKVSDRTASSPEQDGSAGGGGADGGEDDAVSAVLSASVTVFDETQAAGINGAIRSWEITQAGLILKAAPGSALEQLGKGDLFLLPGDPSTPLGETYIGKIAGIDSTSGTYLIEDPMFDEVFDELDFSLETAMTSETVTSISTVPGLTARMVGAADSVFAPEPGAPLEAVPLSQGKTLPMGDLILEGSVDLFEVFGMNEKGEGFFEKYSAAECHKVTVYRTTTGGCYHRDSCPCVGRSIFEMTLSEAKSEELLPCNLCMPPVPDDYITETLTFSGKVGLRDVLLFADLDWNIAEGSGIETLNIGASGDIHADLTLKAAISAEISGQTTQRSLALGSVKVQGLKEKLFPLAFIECTTGLTASSNQGIRGITGTLPVCIGLVIYADVEGNVSANATLSVNYDQPFSTRMDVVRDGQWVWDVQNGVSEPQISTTLSAEFKADLDGCVGASMDLYVFNVNVMELVIVQLGVEGQGLGKLQWTTGTPDSGILIERDFHTRLYLKFLGLNIRAKLKVDLGSFAPGGKLGGNAEIKYNYLFLDKTLMEWGSKNSANFQSATMSYGHITARDGEAVYFKDTDGKLIREEDGYRSVLYEKPFFSFCGIDETYLYLTVSNENGSYDVVRANKRTGLGKTVLTDVARCLTNDDRYLYFVSDFDESTVCRYDREKEKEQVFSQLSDSVIFLEEQSTGFYAVTKPTDLFSMIWGGNCTYWRLTREGLLQEKIGQYPDLPDLLYSDLGGMYSARLIVDNGHLRHTSNAVYLVSGDRSKAVQTETLNGWNYFSGVGILTTRESQTGKTPYEIVLWKDPGAPPVHFADVTHEDALFTLCRSGLGSWYFFDETEEGLVLCHVSPDLSRQERVEVLKDLPCDLTECGTAVMDDRIYFYTMPDQWTSRVLYRYNIV